MIVGDYDNRQKVVLVIDQLIGYVYNDFFTIINAALMIGKNPKIELILRSHVVVDEIGAKNFKGFAINIAMTHLFSQTIITEINDYICHVASPDLVNGPCFIEA